MANQQTAHYIDKAEFLNKIIEYKKTCAVAKKAKKPKPQIPQYLAKCLMMIAENLARKPRYSGYTFRDIMVSDAVENCVRYFDNFDPAHPKKNPFGYFTQCCMYAFWRRIHIEKKELYTKYKIAQQAGVLDDAGGNEGDDFPDLQPGLLYDNISEFIKKFEESLNKAKEKKPSVEIGLIPEQIEKLFE